MMGTRKLDLISLKEPMKALTYLVKHVDQAWSTKIAPLYGQLRIAMDNKDLTDAFTYAANILDIVDAEYSQENVEQLLIGMRAVKTFRSKIIDYLSILAPALTVTLLFIEVFVY